jgi:hypothetical protein
VLVTVHVLMPLIGIKGVILTGAGIHVALGLSRLLAHRSRQPASGLALATGVGAFALTAIFGGLDPQRVAAGVFRTGLARLPADDKVSYVRDGETATITLHEREGVVTIATNGKPDAGIRMGPGEASSDELTTVLMAAIPLSLHPGATRVANIGFGSGVTTHTLLASTELQHLDTIEIEPTMVEAARIGFGARIRNVFEDPRSHVVYEDAKTFFAASHEPYDLIVSEPSNPWVSGVASLFSDEFYGRMVHYLRPDGYFVQWVQIYETDVGVVSSVLKALSRHFGAYALYNLNDVDILIVATRAPALSTPTGQFLQWPGMRAELERVGVRTVSDLQSQWIGDNRTLGPFFNAQPVPVNSDFFPFVDLNASRLRFLGANALELTRLTLLSIPVQDLLRADTPSGPTLEPSNRSTLARHQQVRRALALRHALAGARLDDLDMLSAAAVVVLRAGAAQCDDPHVQEAWKIAARNIGTLTASYLSPIELADVWSSIRATPCYRDVSGPHKVWADLLTAVAARDAAQIVTIGARLLETTSSPSRDERTYLATVVATAYVRLGQPTQARELLTAQWDQLDHGGELALSLNELLALVQAGDHPALADSRPTDAGTHGT